MIMNICRYQQSFVFSLSFFLELLSIFINEACLSSNASQGNNLRYEKELHLSGTYLKFNSFRLNSSIHVLQLVWSVV